MSKGKKHILEICCEFEYLQFALQVVEDIFPVMVKDALITSHPVSTEIKDPEEIQQFFDMISYNKVMIMMTIMIMMSLIMFLIMISSRDDIFG